ncbi:adenosine deaminase [Nocardia tenerifensis]|uniref:Adenine deaminase n=1 Tax=Nocardia tenerifensis TaxID=228006 RepID=A0A318JYY3_9NOCA|nr:adenosine deaminase [Nocardia tenerifensis]PXX63189.1 adenosine deaminase [Nocardia tenerifensis]
MSVPKAELHLHIEGTLEPELAFALAERNGAELPFASVQELHDAYRFEDLQSFLDLYYRLTDVLRTERDFTELAEAYLVRASAAGVRHAEIFFDPQAHTSRGVPFATVIDGLWAALRDSERRYGISTKLILCFLRDLSAESALETLSAAEPYLDRIVAVGLDSAEVGHPPAKFAAVYRRARELGLRAVAHAGEEGPASYVAEALDVLGVERIDHGIRVLEDPALVERLVRERIPLTVCPFSNVRLRVIDKLTDHPLRLMLELGLVATVNSDDPAYFGGYVQENLDGVRDALGLSDEHLRTLARNSFEASFIDERTRARYLGEVEAYRF